MHYKYSVHSTFKSQLYVQINELAGGKLYFLVTTVGAEHLTTRPTVVLGTEKNWEEWEADTSIYVLVVFHSYNVSVLFSN